MNELSKKSSLRARNLLLSMSLGMFLILLVAASNNPMMFAIVPEGGGGGGGGSSPVAVYVPGDEFYSATPQASGTGQASYARITQYDYTKIEVKASAYWDIIFPKGGSADLILKYHLIPQTSGLNAYDLKTSWNWNGKIFDDDKNEVFVQLKITVRIFNEYEGLDKENVKTWGGNGYYVREWNDENVGLTHFNNIYLRGGRVYTVIVTVHVEANGATPYSNTNYVDFMDGSREMKLKQISITP